MRQPWVGALIFYLFLNLNRMDLFGSSFHIRVWIKNNTSWPSIRIYEFCTRVDKQIWNFVGKGRAKMEGLEVLYWGLASFAKEVNSVDSQIWCGLIISFWAQIKHGFNHLFHHWSFIFFYSQFEIVRFAASFHMHVRNKIKMRVDHWNSYVSWTRVAKEIWIFVGGGRAKMEAFGVAGSAKGVSWRGFNHLLLGPYLAWI